MMTVKELRDYLDQLCREGKEFYEVVVVNTEHDIPVMHLTEGDIDVDDKCREVLL